MVGEALVSFYIRRVSCTSLSNESHSNLLKFQLDGFWVHSCHSVTDFMANLKRICFTATFELDEHAEK